MAVSKSMRGHKHGDMEHTKVPYRPIHNISKGVAINKKFGFTMEYKRFNRKGTIDEVEFL